MHYQGVELKLFESHSNALPMAKQIWYFPFITLIFSLCYLLNVLFILRLVCCKVLFEAFFLTIPQYYIILYTCSCMKYIQTCKQRPLKGETEYDLYRQVVFILRSLFNYSLKSYSGMTFINRVVFIQRWSLTRVWLYLYVRLFWKLFLTISLLIYVIFHPNI